MKSKEEKIAYIVYLMIREKTLNKYQLRQQLSSLVGYNLRYEYFKKYYNKALLVLQEGNVTFSDESDNTPKTNSTEIKDSKKVILKEHKNEDVNHNIHSDFFSSEEPLFIEDYFLENDNATQTIQNDIDELFSSPVSEFQNQPAVEQKAEDEKISTSQEEQIPNIDYTNDKEEVPEIFEPMQAEQDEAVSDTNSKSEDEERPFDKSKVKRKKPLAKKETLEVELVDENIGDGYKYYKFMDVKVWFDLDKYSSHLKKELRVTDESDIEYTRDWYANLLLLNVYYNEYFEKENPKLFEQLREHGIEENIYGAPVLKNIHDKYSNFVEFSEEYPDFKNSKSIKSEDVFWIITEWKKGTATKKYLDSFIGKIKRTILEEYDGVSEKDIDNTIDTALIKWERDIVDVRTRSDNFQFVGDEVFDLHHFDYLQEFLPERILLNYEPPMNIDDDFSLLLSRPQGKNLYERTLEIAYILARSKIDDSKTRLWKMNMKIYKDEELKRFWREEVFLIKEGVFGSSDLYENEDEFRRVTKEIQTWNARMWSKNYQNGNQYKDFIKKQEKWVFEYNKEVLESKKEIILQEFEENGISI